MINTSNEYKEKIRTDRTFYAKADIELPDGTVLHVQHNEETSDIMSGGFKLEDGTSGSGSFDIGAAVINQFTLILNNADEKYSQYDFVGAVIRPQIGLKLSDTVEWLKKGVFTVDEANTPGNTIVITALDNMEKFDRPYTDSTLAYPATLSEIVRDACQRCRVALDTMDFDQSDYEVAEKPQEANTFREVLSAVAQIAGCYCRCNVDGHLELKWYDFSAFENDDNLYGGHFDRLDDSRYLSGDTADGGRFQPWNDGDVIDGGRFTQMQKYHHLYALYNQEIAVDDVVITGMRVTTGENDSFLNGTPGYVLNIEKNALIQPGKEQEIAEHLGKKLIGVRFRPLKISAQSDPSIEAGDIAYVSDRKGNSYQTVITNLSFEIGNAESYICDAETPSRNSATRYSDSTKAVVEARKSAEKQLTVYEQAATTMMQLISQGFGLYFTVKDQEDGSKKPYLHDKPTIEESRVVWTVTSTGLMVSKDETMTWAVDVNGNALFNVITARGLNADWINTGTLTVGGSGYMGMIRVRDPGGSQVASLSTEGITATAGAIGGFKIIADELYHPYASSGNLGVGMSSSGSKYGFWAGETNGANGSARSDAKFRVGNNGKLFATEADITGRIIATDGAFNGTVNASSGVFSSITVSGSTWSGGNVNSASVNSPSISGGSYSNGSMSGGSYSSGNMYGCTVPSNSALYMGSSANYVDYSNSGAVRVSAGGSAGVILSGAGGIVVQDGSMTVMKNLYVQGDFSVSGANKHRVIETKNYGMRAMSAFETPLPTFSDYGKGRIAEDGFCYIFPDPVFLETIITSHESTVFLTKYGPGDVWVDEEKSTDRVIAVAGTPGLKFSWETRFLQIGNTGERNEPFRSDEGEIDYEKEGSDYVMDYERRLQS